MFIFNYNYKIHDLWLIDYYNIIIKYILMPNIFLKQYYTATNIYIYKKWSLIIII